MLVLSKRRPRPKHKTKTWPRGQEGRACSRGTRRHTQLYRERSLHEKKHQFADQGTHAGRAENKTGHQDRLRARWDLVYGGLNARGGGLECRGNGSGARRPRARVKLTASVVETLRFTGRADDGPNGTDLRSRSFSSQEKCWTGYKEEGKLMFFKWRSRASPIQGVQESLRNEGPHRGW